MRIKPLLMSTMFALSAATAGVVRAEDAPATPPKAPAAAMDHFSDQRLGVLIHWGPAVLRNAEISWSMSNRAKYEAVYPKFNPQHFDPAGWVAASKSLGAKYVVYVCKHHDGFCMWDTKTTDNNVMNTPFKTDVVAALAKACEAANVQFGTYLSIMDIHEARWEHCYAARTKMPGYPEGIPHLSDITAKQTLELLKYHPLMMWYDGAWVDGWRTGSAPADVAKQIRAVDPDVLITRLGNSVDDYECMEARIGTYRDTPWEMVTSVAYPSYSFNTHLKYKTVDYLTQAFTRVACGNGNLLLGLIPDADGAIPDVQQKLAAEFGQWVNKNSDALFGTRAGPYYPNNWGGSTHKGNKMYLFLLPGGPEKLDLPPCGGKVVSTRVLSGGDIQVKQTDAGLEVDAPNSARDPNTSVVEVTLDSDVGGMIAASKPKAPVKVKNTEPPPAEERPASKPAAK